MFIEDSPSAIKVYEQKNAINHDDKLGRYFISEEKFQSLLQFEVFPDDILVSCAGTIGETYILPKDSRPGIINQALMYVRLYIKEIAQFYLMYFDYILKSKASTESKGTAIKNIPPFDILKGFPFPLPPLKEQLRIVEEVNKIFRIIDNIDENKDEITSLIQISKSKILSLAIQGKLVEQDPADEPASELLRRVNPGWKPDDKSHYPYDIPNTWQWVYFKDISIVARGGSPRPIKDYLTQSQEGINWIKIGDAEKDGKYISSTKERIKPEGISRSRMVHAGDFLLTNSMSFGHPYILNVSGCIHDGWLVISLIKDSFDKDFLYYLLSSDFAFSQFTLSASGGVVSNLNVEKVQNTFIPLPPFSEQKRIVEKIEGLFKALDAIQAELTSQ